MRWNTFERDVGTTFIPTWVTNSVAPPSTITSALIDRTNTVVDSVTAISSGPGSYFAMHQLGNSPGPYVNEWRAWVNSYQYVNRQYLKIIDPQVD